MKFTFRKYKNHYRDNLKLAIPVVISQLGHTLVHASDSIIVGHFAGTVSLAAVSLASSIFVVPMIIGIGISYGSTPLIAQHNARRQFKACGLLLSNSLFINILSGIFLFSLIALGSAYALDHIKQDLQVAAQAKPFLILLASSIIPMLVFNTFKQFAEGLGFTKQAMLISIWGNILNICLGIIFVKGMFGIKPMGIMGVGYSTLIDRCTMALVMAIYVFRSKHFKKYLIHFSVKNIDGRRCMQILGIGGPVAAQYGFEVSAFSGAAVMIGSIGLVQLAAHQIAINLASITYMMSSGLSAAAAIKSGNYFGVRNHAGLRRSANASYHVVIGFMVFTALLFILGNTFLPWIYTSDKAVILVASQLLIIAGLFQLFDGTQVIGLGILRGMSDVNIPTFITFIAYWIVGLPLGWALGIYLNMGVSGVWYGLTAGLLVSAILLYARFKIISHKHRLADRNTYIIARD